MADVMALKQKIQNNAKSTQILTRNFAFLYRCRKNSKTYQKYLKNAETFTILCEIASQLVWSLKIARCWETEDTVCHHTKLHGTCLPCNLFTFQWIHYYSRRSHNIKYTYYENTGNKVQYDSTQENLMSWDIYEVIIDQSIRPAYPSIKQTNKF